MKRSCKGGSHPAKEFTGDLKRSGKDLDGPLDRSRITLRPIDPRVLREQRRRELYARLGVWPDGQIQPADSTDDE
jgi:8-oxo-dGTP pyrophosphatase MutT (NUDIX family)